MRKFIKKQIRLLLRKIISVIYSRQYLKLLKMNNIPNKPVRNENLWIKKWSVLGTPNPVYYRLFSRYIGEDMNIIPEDICRNIVEPILNPLRYEAYYSDKNIFDKLFGEDTMPKTIIRKMNGFYYDAEYNKIDQIDDSVLNQVLTFTGVRKIVIKPAVDSCSGVGVKIFQKKDKCWMELGSNVILDVEYINKNYGDNIIMQECLEQSEYLSMFNPTSVNTLRLSVYRSVETDVCYVTNAVIRIGGKGALIDNAHAGGGYVGIKDDGTLCNCVLDQYGAVRTEFNGIDFTQEHKIPNWETIVDFAKEIAKNISHHRLLALDIMVDKSNKPKLIEFNCKSYSMWLFQFTHNGALGQYTDEIIEYCKNNIDKAEKIILA